MIYIISNTLFGFKNKINQDFWFNNQETFIDILSSIISKRKTESDILVHLGNLFNSKTTLNTQIINQTQQLFEKISKIIPVYILPSENDIVKNIEINTINVLKNINGVNVLTEPKLLNNSLFVPFLNDFKDYIIKQKADHLFCNNNLDNPAIIDYLKNNFKKVYNGSSEDFSMINNIAYVGSNINLKDNKEKGYYILNESKSLDVFRLNDFSPTYKYITINKEEDLIIDSKNIYDIKIDNEFFDNNKTKVEIFLTNHNIIKYEFINKDEVKTEEVIIDNVDIDEMILDELKTKENSEELIEEFKLIKKLSNKYE